MVLQIIIWVVMYQQHGSGWDESLIFNVKTLTFNDGKEGLQEADETIRCRNA